MNSGSSLLSNLITTVGSEKSILNDLLYDHPLLLSNKVYVLTAILYDLLALNLLVSDRGFKGNSTFLIVVRFLITANSLYVLLSTKATSYSMLNPLGCSEALADIIHLSIVNDISFSSILVSKSLNQNSLTFVGGVISTGTLKVSDILFLLSIVLICRYCNFSGLSTVISILE